MSDLVLEAPLHVAEHWLEALGRAADARDAAGLSGLFVEDCHWRDLVALTWSIETISGRDAVAERLARTMRAEGLSMLRLDPAAPPPRRASRFGAEVLEAFFVFETGAGRGRGLVRLRPGPDEEAPRAWTLLTSLEELKGFEEPIGDRRPTGQANARDFRGPNWLDRRRAHAAFEDREPAVLIVGAGQAGLALGARLAHLGVDALIVDRNARIGDNWRLRYHALTLHNQVQVNHLPYMPFPPGWPAYIPKDKLAGWFEAYAEAMELDVWTGAELTGARRDPAEERWTATLRMADGSERVVHPRHVVMANGVSAIPSRPDIPSLPRFAGTVLHSSEYRDGEEWAGRRAIVLGTGNSGHDIAQDLHSSGAEVTLVQRSPTLVVNIEPSAQLPYAIYGDGDSLEDTDLIAAATPTPLGREAHRTFTETARRLDAPLLEGLEKAGFQLDFGEDGSGWQYKYLTRGGGYYFNVGCSDLVAAGEIALVRNADIEGFVAEGARMKSGETLPADLIVLATGYKGQAHLVEKLFGEAAARRVGPIWGFGNGQELRAMYVRTGQPGLWFIAGSLAQCRIYSKPLALQIKAVEEGLIPPG